MGVEVVGGEQLRELTMADENKEADHWEIRREAFKVGRDGGRLSEMPVGLSSAQQDAWIDGWTDGEWSRYAREGMRL